MSAQLSIFDLQAGIRGRDTGIDRIIERNADYIETARGVARLIARRRGLVSMDDVRNVLSDYGIAAPHKNAIGAVFRGQEWIAVGMIQSAIPSNHGRFIRTWRLREPGLNNPLQAVSGAGA